MNLKLEHIVIGILLLAAFGVITLPGIFEQPAAVPGVPTEPGVIVTCDSTVTPDLTITAYDIDNPTTTITDNINLYRKKPSGTWTIFTLGSETNLTNLEFGATYEFFMPLATATSSADAQAHCKYISWTAPCKEDTTMTIHCANDETYDGFGTPTWYNADDTAGTGEDFTTGQVQTVSAKWTAGADQYFGHPYLTSYPMLSDNGNHRRQYPNILCLKLNSTGWEEPQEVYLSTGQTMNRVSNPTISAADGATTHIMYCYEFPVVDDKGIRVYMTMEADGTNAPLVDDKAYLYAGGLYINSDTGVVEWGVEDNQANYVSGDGDADELTLDWTA